jgi:hypothetical protein
LIFSRLERAAAHAMPKIEGVLAADNAVLSKQPGNGPRAHARNHLDNRLPRWADRPGELEVDERGPGQNQDQKNYQKTSHKRGPLVDWILY